MMEGKLESDRSDSMHPGVSGLPFIQTFLEMFTALYVVEDVMSTHQAYSWDFNWDLGRLGGR